MKTLRILCVFAAVLLATTAAAPAADFDCNTYPVEGTYTTYNGSLLPGRATEAFCYSPYHGGVPGNAQNAESWNYVALGTQWKVYGMAIDANGAVETGREVDALGNGWVSYRTFYEGGRFWFSKDHTWGDGINDLEGSLSNYYVDATLILEGGVTVEVYSTIHFTGAFDDCPNVVLSYVITNAARIWAGDAGDLPADYPPLYCAGAPGGEAFTICCATANIVRNYIGTEDKSWGGIKQLHR